MDNLNLNYDVFQVGSKIFRKSDIVAISIPEKLQDWTKEETDFFTFRVELKYGIVAESDLFASIKEAEDAFRSLVTRLYWGK